MAAELTSMERAAQCWCDPRTSDRVMDPELAKVVSAAIDAAVSEALEKAEGLTTVKAEEPPRHEKSIVHRDGFVFTATPCYGMHEPWWVVKTMGGQAVDPVPMRDSDRWRRLRDSEVTDGG